MKSAVIIMLLFAVLMQPLSRLAIYASFKINRDYIAKNLCVNRDVPQSTCQGSCILNRQLKQQDEKENEVPESFKLKEVVFYNHGNQNILFSFNLIETFTFATFDEQHTHRYHYGIFHPPKYT